MLSWADIPGNNGFGIYPDIKAVHRFELLARKLPCGLSDCPPEELRRRVVVALVALVAAFALAFAVLSILLFTAGFLLAQRLADQPGAKVGMGTPVRRFVLIRNLVRVSPYGYVGWDDFEFSAGHQIRGQQYGRICG